MASGLTKDEGETRVLAASMTMEEVFTGTKEFKQQVFEKVQLELDQFGLWIYNANVRQLVDVPGHEYFSYLGLKAQMEANQVSVVTAEAMAKIDEKMKAIAMMWPREHEMRRIKVETEVKVYENERAAEVAVANLELAKKKGATRVAELEEATKMVTLGEAELQVEVERMNALTATENSQLKVQYEIKVQEVNWELYKKMAEAEAQKALADATFYARKQAAEAEFYAKKKEAEGIVIVGNAIDRIGNNYPYVRDYLMITGAMFQENARIKAEAKIKAEVYVNKIVRLVFGVIVVILVIVVLIKLMAPASEAWLVVKR